MQLNPDPHLTSELHNNNRVAYPNFGNFILYWLMSILIGNSSLT